MLFTHGMRDSQKNIAILTNPLLSSSHATKSYAGRAKRYTPKKGLIIKKYKKI